MNIPSEAKYGEFFKQWVNKTHSLDFTYSPEEEQKTDIDGYLISENDRIKLGLQMKTPDKESIRNSINNTNAILKGKEMELIDYDLTEWINNMIGEAENKYSSVQRQNLILLLTAFDPPFRNSIKIDELITTRRYSLFRGIYYIVLPTPSVEYLKNGCVVVIKNAFK